MTKLTANQEAVIRTILDATHQGQFIGSDGEFGVWFDTLAKEAVAHGVKDLKQARVTVNQMIKKNLFKVDTTIEEGSSWLALTDAGKEALTQVLLPKAEESEEDLLGTQDVEEGTPEDEVAEALAEIEAEAEEDLVGDVRGEVQTETENYTVREWHDGDDVEFTETLFKDGSRTLKRRKKVSGSWRTDYWGAENAADKDAYTTAKLAKMARAYGQFRFDA